MTSSDLPDLLADRVAAIARWVDHLSDDLDGIAETLEEQWPTPMIREGFRDHFRTWGDTAPLVRGLRRELQLFGGFDALETWSAADQGREVRARTPESIVHLWPSLPGAGVTPVLYGALLGVEQSVRPASEGAAFAERVGEHWNAVSGLPPLEVRSPDDDTWLEADVVVVSGTDATLREIRERALREGRGRETTITGYGHRVSFGVVPEGGGVDLEATAHKMARDAVLWNQVGCFSLRGVLVGGSMNRCEEFCRLLGAEIAAWEGRLDAVPTTDSDASIGVFERRMQARQVAEVEDRLYGEGFGWAERREEAFRGDWISLHTVSCHAVDGSGEVSEVVDVEPWHLQGAACPEAGAGPEWGEALARTGVTRVCAPGALQAPPPDWLHDGRPNVASWLRATTRDR